MIDIEYHKKAAKEFVGEGSGYIHSEMKNGRAPELVISGDTFAMLWQICGMFDRLSQITGLPYNEILQLTGVMHQAGYDSIKTIIKDEPKKFYVGDDWDEKWKADMTEQIKRENASESISLAISLAEMEKRATSLNNQLVDFKKKHTREMKAKDDQIKALTKECNSLEHRMKEMEEQRLFPEE